MELVQNILFPKNIIKPERFLYFSKQTTVDYSGNDDVIVFKKNDVLCLNTYFNSFFARYYLKYSDVENFYYSLIFEGDFCVHLYSEDESGVANETLRLDFKNCSKFQAVKIDLSAFCPRRSNVRFFLRISALSDYSCFYKGFLATDTPKIREISLAIIICTFKKELFLRKTTEKIISNESLKEKEIKLYVIDNGQTLKPDQFPDNRTHLIKNRNVGGSGGFTRGLIEAIDNQENTHFLFMDDDIELNSESIVRLCSFLNFSHTDLAVAGSLLDIDNKHVLYESGAQYGTKNKSGAFFNNITLTCKAINKNLDLSKEASLTRLLKEISIDYGGFWFFSFSREIVQKVGCLLPVFKTIDDMEFGIRINKLAGEKIIALPGISVWHRTFATHGHPLDVYFYLRNHLIIHAIHFKTAYLKIILIIFLYISARLLKDWKITTLNYSMMALKDFYKGPVFFQNNKPEDILMETLSDSKKIENSNIYSHCFLFAFYIIELISIVITKRKKWYAICGLWEIAGRKFTTFEFWKDYLKWDN